MGSRIPIMGRGHAGLTKRDLSAVQISRLQNPTVQLSKKCFTL